MSSMTYPERPKVVHVCAYTRFRLGKLELRRRTPRRFLPKRCPYDELGIGVIEAAPTTWTRVPSFPEQPHGHQLPHASPHGNSSGVATPAL
jgi:hypothetical protein